MYAAYPWSRQRHKAKLLVHRAMSMMESEIGREIVRACTSGVSRTARLLGWRNDLSADEEMSDGLRPSGAIDFVAYSGNKPQSKSPQGLSKSSNLSPQSLVCK